MPNAMPRKERVFYSSAFLPIKERFEQVATYRLLCSDRQWARITEKQQRLESEALRADRYGTLWDFERDVLHSYYGRTCTGSPKQKFSAPTPRVLRNQNRELGMAARQVEKFGEGQSEAEVRGMYHPTPERTARRIWPHRPEFAHRYRQKTEWERRVDTALGFEVHPDLVMHETLREQYNRLAAIHVGIWDAICEGRKAVRQKIASRPCVPAYPDPLTDLDAQGYCEYWFASAAFSRVSFGDQPKDYRIRCSPMRRALIHSRHCLLLAFAQASEKHPKEPLFKNTRSVLRNFERDVIRQYGVDQIGEDW